MDETEKRLLTEGNALKARELDLREKRNAALLATLRASLVTVAAIAAAWWGIGVLGNIGPAVGRAVFWTAGVAVFPLLFGLWCVLNVSAEDDDDAKYLFITLFVLVGLLLGSVFIAALSWSRF